MTRGPRTARRTSARALKSIFTNLAGALGGAAATQQLQQQYGINLERDVFGWIGDIGLFVRGSDKASLEGGLVIEATNADNMRGAFGKLVGLIQSQGGQKVEPVKVKGAAAAFKVDATALGKPVIIARSDERVVIGVGEAAVADGLSPADKLGDSELYAQAQAGARRLRAHVPALDARRDQGGRRLGRHRRRLGGGEALPRGVHGDRQRRLAEGRRAALARRRRAEVARGRSWWPGPQRPGVRTSAQFVG